MLRGELEEDGVPGSGLQTLVTRGGDGCRWPLVAVKAGGRV